MRGFFPQIVEASILTEDGWQGGDPRTVEWARHMADFIRAKLGEGEIKAGVGSYVVAGYQAVCLELDGANGRHHEIVVHAERARPEIMFEDESTVGTHNLVEALHLISLVAFELNVQVSLGWTGTMRQMREERPAAEACAD